MLNSYLKSYIKIKLKQSKEIKLLETGVNPCDTGLCKDVLNMKIEITSNKLDFIKIKHVSVSKDTTKKVKKKKNIHRMEKIFASHIFDESNMQDI